VRRKTIALEFLTGTCKKTLAVDNIFVFVVVFSFFAIPQNISIAFFFFGIIGALIFRIIFIALGTLLLQYQFIVIVFDIFNSHGIQILFAPEKPINPKRIL
jgi:tellurite resistance protein TerC